MLTKIYWLHALKNSAKIGIMARPRGNDWLEDEIINLKNQKVDTLVSLLERSEIYELGLICEEEICLTKNLNFINFPINDRDIPEKGEALEQLLELLATKLTQGNSVVVHCRMGIGRSSIVAAAVLLKFNLKADDIIQNICTVRGLRVPDTDQQLDWLKNRE